MPTRYDQLYKLQLQLRTALFKLNKAEARVKNIQQEIAKLNDYNNKWDVT